MEPSPSPDSTVDLAVVVRDHVADDGEAEAGAAGLAAAGLVDPVEALEDPLEVAGRDADAVVGDGDLDLVALGGGLDLDRAAGVGVLHRVVEQVGDAPRRAGAGRRPRRARRATASATTEMPACSAAGRMRSTASCTMSSTATASGAGSLAQLDAAELEQVVDGAADAEGLVLDAGRPGARSTSGSSSACERLGQQADGADRRLELVADVGHEVACAPPRDARRSVMSSTTATRPVRPPLDSRGAVQLTTHDPTRWAEQVDGAARRHALQRRSRPAPPPPPRRGRRRGGRRRTPRRRRCGRGPHRPRRRSAPPGKVSSASWRRDRASAEATPSARSSRAVRSSTATNESVSEVASEAESVRPVHRLDAEVDPGPPRAGPDVDDRPPCARPGPSPRTRRRPPPRRPR